MSSTTIDSHVLAAALDQVLPAISTDPERPVLTCLLVEVKDGSLRLVATDSYRLVVRDLALEETPAGEFRAIVAGTTMRRLRGLLDARGTAELGVRNGTLELHAPGGAGEGSLVDTEYPDYEQLLAYDGLLEADAPRHVLQVDRAQLLAALRGYLEAKCVLLRFRNGRLAVSGRDDEGTELEATYTGDGIAIALNPVFADQAATSAVGPELVLEATEPLHPVVFRSADDGTYVCMVMPVRLD